MDYGYAVSHHADLLHNQVKMLERENLNKIIKDRTGEKLSDLIDSLKPGDSLHITSPDRLSCISSEFVKIAEQLLNNNVRLYVRGYKIELYDVYASGVKAEKIKKETTASIMRHRKEILMRKETE